MLRGPTHRANSSGSVIARKTFSGGASNSRVIRMTGSPGSASIVVWCFVISLMMLLLPRCRCRCRRLVELVETISISSSSLTSSSLVEPVETSISASTSSSRANRSSASRRYRSIHLVIRSNTSASRCTGRRWASRVRLTSPASSSTLTCLETAWTLTSYGAASSPTLASPPAASRATMSRRVGSARAWKTRESWSATATPQLVGCIHARTSCRRLVNHLVAEAARRRRAESLHAHRAHHRDHRPGRPVPRRAPADQGLRGPRRDPRPEQPEARPGPRACSPR